MPATNLIGQENAGFLLLMSNFNHERFYANAQPDEIRGFATVRYLGNRLLPEAARLPTLGAVFAALSYGVAFSNAPGGASDSAEAALALIKPVLGVLFGSLFAASLYGVATASRAKRLL